MMESRSSLQQTIAEQRVDLMAVLTTHKHWYGTFPVIVPLDNPPFVRN